MATDEQPNTTPDSTTTSAVTPTPSSTMNPGWFLSGLLIGLSLGMAGGWWLTAGNLGFEIQLGDEIPQDFPSNEQPGYARYDMDESQFLPTEKPAIGVIGDPLEAELAWDSLSETEVFTNMPEPMPRPEYAEPISDSSSLPIIISDLDSVAEPKTETNEDTAAMLKNILADADQAEQKVLQEDLQDLSPEQALELLDIRNKIPPLVDANVVGSTPESVEVVQPVNSILVPHDLASDVAQSKSEPLLDDVDQLLTEMKKVQKTIISEVSTAEIADLEAKVCQFRAQTARIRALEEIRRLLVGCRKAQKSPHVQAAKSPEETAVE